MTCHRIGSKASHSRPCVADWARQDRNDARDPGLSPADRSLVLVPSDALRRQIAKKPEKPGDRRDVNRSRDAFGGDSSDCGCRHGGYAASGAAGIAGSDCIHDAGELRFWSVDWMYQDHFLQADFWLPIGSR
jgi:hypothetical protein